MSSRQISKKELSYQYTPNFRKSVLDAVIKAKHNRSHLYEDRRLGRILIFDEKQQYANILEQLIQELELANRYDAINTRGSK